MAISLIPGLGPRNAVPRPRSAADLTGAGLSAQEGWVLSRVDGQTSFAELFLITGLGEQQTVDILRRLIDRGLVVGQGGPPAPSAPPGPPPRAPSTKPPAPSRGSGGGAAVRSADGGSGSGRVSQGARGQADAKVMAAEQSAATAHAAAAAREGAAAREEQAMAAAAKAAELAREAEAPVRVVEEAHHAAQLAEAQARASVEAARSALAAAEVELGRCSALRVEVESRLGSAQEQAQRVRAAAQETMTRARHAQIEREHAAQLESSAVRDAAEKAQQAQPVAVRRETGPLPLAPASPAQPDTGESLRDLLRGYAAALDAPPPVQQAPQPVAERAAAAPIAGGAEALPPPEPVSAEQAEELDPEVLAKAPSLPLAVRKRILRKHKRLGTDDMFELLEVDLGADGRAIKRAYFKLSKEFHPDRYFRKALGPFATPLSEIFNALTQANEYLIDDERRAEYEKMIGKQHELRALETALERATKAALEEDRRQEEEAEASASAMPTAAATVAAPAAAPDAPVVPMSASTSQSGRVPLSPGRHTMPAAPARPAARPFERPRSATPGGSPTSPSSSPSHASPAPRRLLRQALSQRMGDERTNKARHHYEEGMRQAQAKEWVAAAANLRVAATLAPGNSDYQAKLDEFQARSIASQAATHLQRGSFERRAGRINQAAEYFQKSADLSPGFEACVNAAEMFLKIRQLEKARRYGIKAAEREPENVQAHMALAQIFRESKQFSEATRSLERVLALDPQNNEAKLALKEVSKLA